MLQNGVSWYTKDNLRLLQFNNLLEYEELITHCFTTRLGGVSTGDCAYLNLGFNKNDKKENVMKNYQLVCDAIDVEIENLVLSKQVHDNRIIRVTSKDKGKGIFIDNDLAGYDGLVTNEPNVVLVTFYADCVPVFFFDPMTKAIGISHSGWRGTMKEIALEMVSFLDREFATLPSNIICSIGPSIRKCCFEVGDEVYEEFTKNLPESKFFAKKQDNDKWHFDLQGIIKATLLKSGIEEKNIIDSGICTKCNKDVFFSHRGDHGKTGSLAAIMSLRGNSVK